MPTRVKKYGITGFIFIFMKPRQILGTNFVYPKTNHIKSQKYIFT